jgi:(2Fe-2S) ferredoxin
LWSGDWTRVSAAATHGVGSDMNVWVAARALGGSGCEWAGPTDAATCRPCVWYGQVAPVEADTIFNAHIINEDVIYNGDLSLAFPTVNVNSNGSVVFNMAYASNYAGDAPLKAENGEDVPLQPGALDGVCIFSPVLF